MPVGLMSATAEASGSVMERGLQQTSSVIDLLGQVSTFVISNELCLLFLGFFFVSRGTGLLKRMIRITPR